MQLYRRCQQAAQCPCLVFEYTNVSTIHRLHGFSSTVPQSTMLHTHSLRKPRIRNYSCIIHAWQVLCVISLFRGVGRLRKFRCVVAIFSVPQITKISFFALPKIAKAAMLRCQILVINLKWVLEFVIRILNAPKNIFDWFRKNWRFYSAPMFIK